MAINKGAALIIRRSRTEKATGTLPPLAAATALGTAAPRIRPQPRSGDHRRQQQPEHELNSRL